MNGNKKCYGYCDELSLCLLHGMDCKATKSIECYHESEAGAIEKNLLPVKKADDKN